VACDGGTVISPLRDGVRSFIRADCKKLSCPLCGPKKAHKYRQAVIHHALDHKLTRFLTLTLDPAKIPDAPKFDDVPRIEYLQKCWRKMRIYMYRSYPGLEFIAVLELQKATGRAHLHILISQFIPQSWIQASWHAVGGGWVSIKQADLHRVSGYVSKYLTKDVLLSIPKGKRRINLSRGMRLNNPPEPGWQWTRTLIESVLYLWELCSEKEESDQNGLRFFQVYDLMESG